MRTREQIKASFDAGEEHGVLDAVAQEVILETLLDIRELLQLGEDRLQKLEQMAQARRRESQ